MGLFSLFSSSRPEQNIEDSDLLRDLPEDQKKYFLKQDLKLKIETKKAESQDELNNLSSKVLQQQQQNKQSKTAHEIQKFEEYRAKNTKRASVLENCSEIQMLLFQCLQNGTYSEKLTMCNVRTKAMFNCIETQRKTLSQLGFEAARSIDDAERIKGISDDLFVKHFGKDGLQITDDSIAKHEEALENMQMEIWK